MRRRELALAALATAAVPGLRPVAVAGLRLPGRSGIHSAMVEDLTGRPWLVCVPVSAAAGAELGCNDALVRQLGKFLPFRVPVAAGYAPLGALGRAVVYPHIEGSALELRNLPDGPGLAGAVGRAVAAIHNLPRELFESAGVPAFDAAACRSRRLAELDRAAETGQVPTGLLARWEQALDSTPLWQFATTPTHGQLGGGSWLVAFADDDAASARVVAIRGWDRAHVGDPAEDFAALVRQARPAALDAVLDSYAVARNQRPDGYLVHRARLAAEMQALRHLAAAVAADDDSAVRDSAEALRRLDRLTAADDSLVPRTALVEQEVVEQEPVEQEVVAQAPGEQEPDGQDPDQSDGTSGGEVEDGGQDPTEDLSAAVDPEAT